MITWHDKRTPPAPAPGPYPQQLENLLLMDRSDLGSVKLADFGLSRTVRRDLGTISDGDVTVAEIVSGGVCAEATATICGTPSYVAPEVVTGRPYSFSVDMWGGAQHQEDTLRRTLLPPSVCRRLFRLSPKPALPPRLTTTHSTAQQMTQHADTTHVVPTLPSLTAGIILYIILSGSAPFQGEDQTALFRAIVRGKFSMARSTQDPPLSLWPLMRAVGLRF